VSVGRAGRSDCSARANEIPDDLKQNRLTEERTAGDNPRLGWDPWAGNFGRGADVNIADCTFPEKILLAANQLEQEGQSPFSAEALIVASWQKFPKTFGLKGYADLYPDSNKILSSIMGEKGLARRGWLVKMGQKLYSLSREGKLVVHRILEGGEAPSSSPTAKLSREQDRLLLSMLNSPAVEKYLENRKQELTFADACRFWGISDTIHGEALDARMNRMRLQLADFERLVGTGGIDLSNGRSVSLDDVAQLSVVNEYLQERFARHLNLLRSRVERT
jgi:hypothetical protein